MDIYRELTRCPFLLNPRETEELTGLDRDQFKRMARCGKFPPPIKLSSRIYRWDMDEVIAWLNERYTERELRHAG